jgi:V8-like Glu-specific endopeptidase
MNFKFYSIAFTLLISTGCKTLFESNAADTKAVFGADDFETVQIDGKDLPIKYRSLPAATGYLSSGCTVTHIGHGLILTAGHCLTPDELFPDDPEQCLPGLTVTFGILKDRTLGPAASCVKNLYSEININRDIALLKVDRFPSVFVEVELDNKPPVNTQLTVFSHPEGKSLQWSKFCNLIEVDFCMSSDTFGFTCDSLPGSSGALVLSDASSKPKAVGILMGSRGENDMNCASRFTANKSAAKIAQFIDKYSGVRATSLNTKKD